MRLVNPLYSPLAVLAGGIVLVLGVRVVRLPSWVAIPTAAVVATAGASVLKERTPEPIALGNPALDREFLQVQQQAQTLVDQANQLREEATRLLTESHQMELLGAVQYACDRASELPAKINQMAKRLSGKDALLSVDELNQQLKATESKLNNSSGVARAQLQRLSDSIQRNIELAKQGEDARQAQVVNLSTLILDAGAVLQQLQNKLRTADFTNSAEVTEMRSLSEEFSGFQENVDLLVSNA